MTSCAESTRGLRPSISGLAGLTVLALALGGCSSATPSGQPSETSSPAADSAGLVEIGDGRSLYLTCRGSGSPIVLFISGTGGASDEWSDLPPDADAESTFVTVSKSTRVCAYDRPGTTDAASEPTMSTVVPQPTTAVQSADDLDALMKAAGESGPYVVVGLSWGGMIAQQFARSHPDEVKGIVLLDSASAFLPATFTPAQWSAWMAAVVPRPEAPDAEVPAYEPSILALEQTPQLPIIPAIVMSSDHPWDLQVTPGESTWPGWVAAQAALASSLDATHITETDSGHGIPVEQPALVTDAILDVIETVRAAG